MYNTINNLNMGSAERVLREAPRHLFLKLNPVVEHAGARASQFMQAFYRSSYVAQRSVHEVTQSALMLKNAGVEIAAALMGGYDTVWGSTIGRLAKPFYEAARYSLAARRHKICGPVTEKNFQHSSNKASLLKGVEQAQGMRQKVQCTAAWALRRTKDETLYLGGLMAVSWAGFAKDPLRGAVHYMEAVDYLLGRAAMLPRSESRKIFRQELRDNWQDVVRAGIYVGVLGFTFHLPTCAFAQVVVVPLDVWLTGSTVGKGPVSFCYARRAAQNLEGVCDLTAPNVLSKDITALSRAPTLVLLMNTGEIKESPKVEEPMLYIVPDRSDEPARPDPDSPVVRERLALCGL